MDRIGLDSTGEGTANLYLAHGRKYAAVLATVKVMRVRGGKLRIFFRSADVNMETILPRGGRQTASSGQQAAIMDFDV